MTKPIDAGPPSIDDQFAYDALGRQILARNTVTDRSFEYDALDRPVSVYDEAFGTARRTYDADGRVVQAVYPDGNFGYPEGRVTTYQYDARGAVVGISDSIGGTWQLDYDAAGRPIRETSPFGVDREVAYTNEGFVDKVTLRNGAGAYLDVFDYNNYDALGNPQQIETCEGMATCSSTSPTGTTTIGYDALSRVTSVSYPGSSESFTYDLAGNRRTHTVNGTLRTLDVDAADQLTAIRQGSTVLESFTYDAAGRRSTRTVGATETTYSYDPLGRLQSIGNPSLTNFVLYDALDSRYYSWSAQTGRADYFLGEWAEMRGSERVRLVHGPGIDAVLAEVSDTTTRALQADAGGNVIHATTGGTIGETRRYGAFGGVRTSSGTQVVSRGFAGRPVEAGSGLVYLRARHYDAATGRFLQPDPIGIETDQLYAYAANNPYVFGDPMGLMPSSIGSGALNLGAGSFFGASAPNLTFGTSRGASPSPSTPVAEWARPQAGFTHEEGYGLIPNSVNAGGRWVQRPASISSAVGPYWPAVWAAGGAVVASDAVPIYAPFVIGTASFFGQRYGTRAYDAAGGAYHQLLTRAADRYVAAGNAAVIGSRYAVHHSAQVITGFGFGQEDGDKWARPRPPLPGLSFGLGYAGGYVIGAGSKALDSGYGDEISAFIGQLFK